MGMVNGRFGLRSCATRSDAATVRIWNAAVTRAQPAAVRDKRWTKSPAMTIRRELRRVVQESTFEAASSCI